MLTQEEKSLTREALRMALDAGALKARIRLSKSSMDLVSTLNGEVDKITGCLDRSLEINIFADGRFGSFSTNRMEKDSLRKFIGDAVGTVRMLAADPARNLPDPSRQIKTAVTGNELGLYDSTYESVTAEKRREYALKAAVFGRNGSNWKLVSEEGEYSDCLEYSYIVDSGGLEALHCETCFSYGVEVTVEDDRGRKYSGYWWDSTPILAEFDPSAIGARALENAVSQIGSRRIRGGRYNMVVDNEVSSRMLSPILSALNGYSIQQNNSFLMDSLGRQVFPESMTVLDCPHIKGQTGSKLFDSEGVATRGHAIIENGVVKEYFLNTCMAGKLGMAPTQEEAIRPKLMPFKAESREDILYLCGSGILVTDFNGGNSNSVTGDFSYGIEGFRFKDGKIVRPVSEMLVTGNFIKLWNNLLAAGSDARPCKGKLVGTLAFKDVDFSG